jgi:hypothetical protein
VTHDKQMQLVLFSRSICHGYREKWFTVRFRCSNLVACQNPRHQGPFLGYHHFINPQLLYDSKLRHKDDFIKRMMIIKMMIL